MRRYELHQSAHCEGQIQVFCHGGKVSPKLIGVANVLIDDISDLVAQANLAADAVEAITGLVDSMRWHKKQGCCVGMDEARINLAARILADAAELEGAKQG